MARWFGCYSSLTLFECGLGRRRWEPLLDRTIGRDRGGPRVGDEKWRYVSNQQVSNVQAIGRLSGFHPLAG
ncbi:hypothetical protein K474DRAFT_1656478 [Panus rudis PR-1116 ss-1]|nr:hypothetical protein K474DRAFT_1656478 [Panus rudis PR-1116 ss-1]